MSLLIYLTKQKQSHITIYQQTRIKVDIPDATGIGGSITMRRVWERQFKRLQTYISLIGS